MSSAYETFPTREGAARSARLASAQYGVISRHQALECGLSKSGVHRRIQAGEWIPLFPGVYALASSPATWEQRLMAGCVWSGAVASCRSAARLLKLDGVSTDVIEVATTGDIRSAHGVIVHRVNALPQSELTVIGGIPATSAARSLMDLAAVLDRASVELALEDALRRGIVTLPRLRWMAKRAGRGQRGSVLIRRLLADRPPGYVTTASPLEHRLLRLITAAGLPKPVTQYELREEGRLLARIDFAYPDKKLAIEADGYKYHSGRNAWKNDLARRNRITGAGWLVIHVTWEDLERRPEEVIAVLSRALSRDSLAD